MKKAGGQLLYLCHHRTFVALCSAAMACSQQVHLVGLKHGDAGVAGGADGGHQLEPWGSWAARLDVPDCPEGEVLTVDTAADELEGGPGIGARSQAGERLSFTEALWIAHNRPGPQTIVFGAQTFPVESPTTITIEGTYALPSEPLEQVCIDGRNRGVVVLWAQPARSGDEAHIASFVWGIGNGSVQMGLEFLELGCRQKLEAGGRIAGCRYASKLFASGGFGGPVISLRGGTLGPGNAFWGLAGGIEGDDAVVRGNSFEFDPRSRATGFPLSTAMFLGGACVIEDNVISGAALDFHGQTLIFRNNWVGLAPETFAPLAAASTAIWLSVSVRLATIGPGNHIRAYVKGIDSSFMTVTTVTRSTFIAQTPIAYNDGLPQVAQPPVIISADGQSVSGTCAVAGRVEVFSGSSGNPEVFLGDAECPTPGPWTAAVSAVSGTQLTATSTALDGRTTVFSKPFPVP